MPHVNLSLVTHCQVCKKSTRDNHAREGRLRVHAKTHCRQRVPEQGCGRSRREPSAENSSLGPKTPIFPLRLSQP